MKKQLGITLALCLLSSTPALANDAVLGALIGGGAGAVVGSSIGGRNAAVIGGALGAAAGAAMASSRTDTRVVYSAPPAYLPPPPPAVYVPAPVFYPPQAYYPPPVRVETRRIYYVDGPYYRPGHAHREHFERYEDRRDWRHAERRRGWDDRD